MDSQKRKKLWWQVPLLVLLVVGTFFIARQQRSATFQHDSGMIFGTIYNVTYQSQTGLQSEIEAALLEVDAEFSMFNDTSTVSRINRGEQPQRSPMFEEVFELAQTVNRETDGAFDITVAPLVNAWGFGFKHEQMPTPSQVDSLLKIRSQYDFSAVAKGYGVDCVAQLLSRQGVRNFMIEIGGEITTRGHNPNGEPWRIGVTKPSDDSLAVSGELQTVLTLTDQSLATSGNYRNFYYKDGRKYAHTIDPRTGYPVQHNILSATVLAEQCAVADAYATSFMVLGLDGARRVLERHPELQAYLIYSDENDSLRVWSSIQLSQALLGGSE